ncbi:MAG: ribonuclease [Burkholderiales bacterium]|nr:ribonuclease [Burkholderiales bacterium]
MRFLTVLLFAISLAPGVGLLRGEAPAALKADQHAPAEIAVAELPREARDTLALIRQGGPFPYDRDSAVFGNFERRLPPRSRGYYREYTVPTPGLKYRGARRIVAGRDGEYYYTDDHYQSFRRITP